jgi:transcriptional regulator with XRE-family HTH domain
MPRTKFSKPDDRFRRALREVRLTSGLSQSALAKKLARPQSYVSKYETGERRLDFVETFFVCAALEIDFVQFAQAFANEMAKLRRVKRQTT